MSFRFVGTALSILGTSTASGYYLAAQAPVGATQGPATVVPVIKAKAPPAHPQTAAIETGAKRTRIWIGAGATTNPMTGEPLTHEEKEQGWVAAAIVSPVPAPPIAPAVSAPVPNPPPPPLPPTPVLDEVSAPPQPAEIKKPQVKLRAIEIAQHPAVEPKKPPTPAPPPAAPAKSVAPAGAYRIHLDSYRDEHLVLQAWSELQKAFPTILGSLQSTTAQLEVPHKGRFTRLLAGSFESRQAAETACAAIKKARHTQYCHPLAIGHETS